MSAGPAATKRLIGLRQLRERHLPDVSLRWLYELARTGYIPAHRLGKRWLVDGDAVIAAIKAGNAGAPPGGEGTP